MTQKREGLPEELGHLVRGIEAPKNVKYVMPVRCPDVPKGESLELKARVPVAQEKVEKRGKKRSTGGIPVPPDLGYKVPPVPSEQEMKTVLEAKLEKTKMAKAKKVKKVGFS